MSLSIPPHLTPLLLTTLRILPLLGSTASLTHAYMEYVTTSSFLTPPPTSSFLTRQIASSKPASTPSSASASASRELADANEMAVSAWFATFFTRAVWSVIGFNTLTTLSAIANLYLYPEGLGSAKPLYFTGLGCAAAHYLFVVGVTPSVEALFRRCVELEGGERKEGERSAVSWLEEWVGVHVRRMGSVDLVAWGCFFVAVVRVLSPGL